MLKHSLNFKLSQKLSPQQIQLMKLDANTQQNILGNIAKFSLRGNFLQEGPKGAQISH